MAEGQVHRLRQEQLIDGMHQMQTVEMGDRLAILEGIQQLMVACQAAIDASKEIRK